MCQLVACARASGAARRDLRKELERSGCVRVFGLVEAEVKL
jgi:hypothetical protein